MATEYKYTHEDNDWIYFNHYVDDTFVCVSLKAKRLPKSDNKIYKDISRPRQKPINPPQSYLDVIAKWPILPQYINNYW